MDAPFDKPFNLIMNVAVGGDYVGNPSLAAGAHEMQVDSVRAYQAVPEPGAWAALGHGAAMHSPFPTSKVRARTMEE